MSENNTENKDIDIDLQSQNQEGIVQQEQIDGLTDEQNKQMDEEAVEIAKSVVNSVTVTDDDKKDLKSDVEEEFQFEFDSFLNKKLDIKNGEDSEKIPTGIDLIDCLTGGGITIGQIFKVVGLPGSFKSTLVAQILGNAQKQYNGKLLSVYYDTEVTMTRKRLMQLGVCNPPLKPYDDVTIEQLFQTIEAMAAYKEAKNITELAINIPDLGNGSQTETSVSVDTALFAKT